MCLSKDVTGHCSFYCIAIPRSLFWPDYFDFSRDLCFFSGLLLCSHSVSVQRRDRSLFFLLHCYTKAPLFTRFIQFFLTLLPPSWTFCCYLFTVCLSKDVAGTLFPILILFDPSTTSSFFCLRSVSVQRRDRYSVSFSCLFRLPPFLSFRCSLLVTQCICPKTWQVLCYLPLTPFLFSSWGHLPPLFVWWI